MNEDFWSWWPSFFTLMQIFVVLLASQHILLNKREPRAALAWIGVIILNPLIGTSLYLLLGINRVHRKANNLRPRKQAHLAAAPGLPELKNFLMPAPALPHLAPLMLMGTNVTDRKMTTDNLITPLFNGDQAYPKMLEAIEQAKKSIALASYIFDRDQVGKEFCMALAAAQERGVQVRVLVDGVGSLYSFPTIFCLLRKHKIPARKFLAPSKLINFSLINLRLHRKLLVIDGLSAFCGGMNIRQAHNQLFTTKGGIQDLHFFLKGPIVNQLQNVFAEDWEFSSGEILQGPLWFPPASKITEGQSLCRVVSDGPDHDFEKIRWMILGALAQAQKSILIMTPYFLPDSSLITALNTAVLRGLKVEIHLPQKSNLPWTHWAMSAMVGQLLEKGHQIYLAPPPFDHTKLMIVDNSWIFFGSANWDARSLRLNFELNVECYSQELGASLAARIEKRRHLSHLLTTEEINQRSYGIKIRDGLAKLLTPVL